MWRQRKSLISTSPVSDLIALGLWVIYFVGVDLTTVSSIIKAKGEWKTKRHIIYMLPIIL